MWTIHSPKCNPLQYRWREPDFIGLHPNLLPQKTDTVIKINLHPMLYSIQSLKNKTMLITSFLSPLLAGMLLLAGGLGCNATNSGPLSELDSDIPQSESFDGKMPFWHPDGTKLGFVHTETDSGFQNNQIWVYDFETGERKKVLNGPAYNPSWSPDGQWITYQCCAFREVIYKASVEQDTIITLTGPESPNELINTGLAQWRSDGQKILFTIIAGTPRGASLMNPDGTDARIVVEYAISSKWYQNGEKIAYINWDQTLQQPNQKQIFTADSNGSNEVKLTDLKDTFTLSGITVSPDGTRMAYTHIDKNRVKQIFIMDIDGSNIRQVTNMRARTITGPRWSPDGQTIAFERRTGSTRLFHRIFLLDVATLEVEPLFKKK